MRNHVKSSKCNETSFNPMAKKTQKQEGRRKQAVEKNSQPDKEVIQNLRPQENVFNPFMSASQQCNSPEFALRGVNLDPSSSTTPERS